MQPTRKLAKQHGETSYFTGLPCKHGHISARRTATGECLTCRAAFLVVWRKRNPSKVKAHNDTQHIRHQAKLAQRAKMYYWKDPEKSRAINRARQKYFLHVYAKAKAKRKAALLKRTPSWLSDDDKWMIDEIYELSALRTKLTGIPWHVDHIVPLQGKLVSGLHVPWNLQVIPGVDNIRKGNR